MCHDWYWLFCYGFCYFQLVCERVCSLYASFFYPTLLIPIFSFLCEQRPTTRKNTRHLLIHTFRICASILLQSCGDTKICVRALCVDVCVFVCCMCHFILVDNIFCYSAPSKRMLYLCAMWLVIFFYRFGIVSPSRVLWCRTFCNSIKKVKK